MAHVLEALRIVERTVLPMARCGRSERLNMLGVPGVFSEGGLCRKTHSLRIIGVPMTLIYMHTLPKMTLLRGSVRKKK